jgi:hypothetical protein
MNIILPPLYHTLHRTHCPPILSLMYSVPEILLCDPPLIPSLSQFDTTTTLIPLASLYH